MQALDRASSAPVPRPIGLKRIIDSSPIFAGQVTLGERKHDLFVLLHVRSLELRIAGRGPRRGIEISGVPRVSEIDTGLLQQLPAPNMPRLQLLEYGVRPGGALPQTLKEILVLLQVVHAFRKYFHMVEHGRYQEVIRFDSAGFCILQVRFRAFAPCAHRAVFTFDNE